MNIREKREHALYEFSRGNDYKRKELISFLLSTISHQLIKNACEHFNLKY